MTPEQWQLIGGVLVALLGLLGSYLVTRQNRRQATASDAQQIIDQVQEERNRAEDRADKDRSELKTEIAELKAEIAAVKAELVRVHAREQVLVEHAWQLRHHINEQLAPPPPSWPEELNR